MDFRCGNFLVIALFSLVFSGWTNSAQGQSGGGGTGLNGSSLFEDTPALPAIIGGGLSVAPGSATGTRTFPDGGGEYPMVNDTVFAEQDHMVIGQGRQSDAPAPDGLRNLLEYLEEKRKQNGNETKEELEKIAKAILALHLSGLELIPLEAIQQSLQVLGGIALSRDGR